MDYKYAFHSDRPLFDTIVLSLSVALVGTGFAIIFPIFPKVLETMGGGAFELGLIASSFGISFTIFSPIFGNLADKWGKRKMILTGMLGFTVSNLLLILADSITMLVVARFIEGAFSSAVFPASVSIVSDIAGDKNRAKYIGYLTAGNSVGLIIGPVLGGYLYNFGLYMPFYVSFLFSAFTFIFFMFKLPRSNSIVSEIIADDRVKMSYKEILRILPKPIHVFIIFGVIDLIAAITWMLVEPGISFHIYNVLLLQPADFGLFVSVYGVSVLLSQILFSGISDRMSSRIPVIAFGLSLNTIFFYLLLITTDITYLLISATIAGIGLGLLAPAMKALLTEVSDQRYTTTILGVEGSFVGMSIFAGPLIGGYLYDTYGMEFVLITSIIMGGISVIFSFFIRFKKHIVD